MRPYPYAEMKEKPDALERLELQFRWGDYGIRVLHWHLVSFAPGHTIRFHKHSEFEFHFIPRGKGSVIMGDETHQLNSGLFYLTGPGVVHQQESDAKEGMDELCLHVDIVPLSSPSPQDWGAEWENREAEACIRTLRHFPLRPFIDRYDAMACFLSAYQTWRSGEAGSYTTIKQLLIQILLKTARASRWQNAVPGALPSLPSRDIHAHRLKMALQYMHDNYANPLTLQEVANLLQISGRQLQRIFQKYGIESFSGYLEDYRLKRICRDLVETSDTVETIARLHGFANSNYLFHVFKRKTGMTPLAYRSRYSYEQGIDQAEGKAE